MSKLEVREIGPISGETEVRLADGATAVGFGGESPIKAWVNFNGSGTVAIRDSMNVSSITDLGVGYYKVNFNSPMSNADYAANISASPNEDGSVVPTNLSRTGVFANPNGSDSSSIPSYEAPTVNDFNVSTSVNAQQSRIDPKVVCIMVTA